MGCNDHNANCRFTEGAGANTDICSTSTSVHRRSSCNNFLGRSIQFFIGAKQKHYNILNKYVFSVLSGAQLTSNTSTTDDIQRLIPEYLNVIPSRSYRYNDAVLHMKKDKQKLEEDIAEFQRQITEYNTQHIELQSTVKSIIEQRISQAGYNKEQDEHFMHMYQWVNTYLGQIKNAKDVHQYAIHIASSEKKGIGTESFVNTIHEIIQDETILGYLDEIKHHVT